MFRLRRNIFSGKSSCQKSYMWVGDSCRASYGATSAAYTIKRFLCTFFKFTSLRICDVLHYIQVLRTCFCTGIASDTAINLRIEFHHNLLVRTDVVYCICSLVCREERNACHIHSFLYLRLAGKTCFQLIVSFDTIDRRAGSAETVAASTSSF